MRRKALFAILVALLTVASMAAPTSANVNPDDPRVGSRASTAQFCFIGTVTFTIVGPGVSIVVGTAVAQPNSNPPGLAVLEFTVPDVTPGNYTMVGTGTRCPGFSGDVRVPFKILPRKGGGNYPPKPCFLDVDRAEALPGDFLKVKGKCFKGKVKFFFNGSEVGTAQVDGDGYAIFKLTVPQVDPGDYYVMATGVDDDDEPLTLKAVLSVLKGKKGAVVPGIVTPPNTPSAVDQQVIAKTPDPAVPTQVLGTVETAARAAAVPVVAARDTSGGVLAFTGGDAAGLVRLAVLILAAGGVLVFAARRRALA